MTSKARGRIIDIYCELYKESETERTLRDINSRSKGRHIEQITSKLEMQRKRQTPRNIYGRAETSTAAWSANAWRTTHWRMVATPKAWRCSRGQH